MDGARVVIVKFHAVEGVVRIQVGALDAIHVVAQLEQFVGDVAWALPLVGAENLAVDVVDRFFV